MVVRPPVAHAIEVFHGEPDRVHRPVATRANRIGAVGFQALPQGPRLSIRRLFSEVAGRSAAAVKAEHPEDSSGSIFRARPATSGSDTT